MTSEVLTDNSLISDYLDTISHYSNASKKSYRATLNRFSRLCVDRSKSLLEVDRKDVSAFLSMYKSLTTKGHYKVTLKVFYDYCIENNFLNVNPVIKIKIKRGKPKQKRLMLDDDFKKILNQCQSLRETTIVNFFYYAGVRSKELRHITIDNIDLERGIVKIDVSKTAEGVRSLPINHRLKPILMIYLEKRESVKSNSRYLFLTKRGTQFNERTIIHLIKTLQRNNDYTFTCHDFRRSCITRLYRATNNIVFCQKFAGHENINTTRKYILDDKKTMNDTIRDLDF